MNEKDERQHLSRSAFAAGLSRAFRSAVFFALVAACSNADAQQSVDSPAGTWFQTVLASRDALWQAEEAEGLQRFSTVTSEVMRGGQQATHICVPISGATEIYLYVTGAPEVIYGAATWADARLIDGSGKETLICHMKEVEVVEGRFDKDCNLESGVSGPLQIAGRQFEHGIHVYAPSKIRVKLDRPCERFEAWIGVDDWVGLHGAVRFHITDAAGATRMDLWPQLQSRYSGATDRRQMKWECEDQILSSDWRPGDFGELARRYAQSCFRVSGLADRATQESSAVDSRAGLESVRELYHHSRFLDEAIARARALNTSSLRLAVEDLMRTHGPEYPAGASYLERLAALEQSLAESLGAVDGGELSACERVAALVADFDSLQRQALMANPLLDFDELLLIRRVPHGDPRRPHGRGYGVGEYIGLPRQSSKCIPGIEEPFAWENEIAVLSPVSPDGRLRTLYRPEGGRLLTDVDLHWDADKLLFSMPGSHDMWHVFEISADGTELRQLTPMDQSDVHFYDSCYLPNGDIAFVSTAPMQGVPCNAGVIVGMMYEMNKDGGDIRQVCFEQDHTYCPTVLPDGRVLYLRWDYTDTPHVWNRVLFSMNPDGTGQTEFYGSNSYWPNSVFYTRPVPGHATKVVGIVTGHHVGRVGELVIFDPARGRHEASGVVQRIPGYGQRVEPLIEDKLTEHSWPKFVHPYPLSEKHFLVSCKPTPDSLWGIYLVDVYDNMVLIKEQERHVLLEPIPLRRTRKPPVIARQTDDKITDALAYIADIYAGPGLEGVPRQSVKSLRVFTYHFGYQQLAGIDHRVGADGPWEVKRVLGTVPVESDGSALFRIPAKTPISIQPLDGDGQAMQLMRSWMTAMPGETLSCVGCHEQRNSSAIAKGTLALTREPSEIQPWFGPDRGFSFKREVQPVLDKHCVGCHDGSPRDDGVELPDLRGDQGVYYAYRHGDPQLNRIEGVSVEKLMTEYRGIFQPSYIALRRLVRVGGLESDLHRLPPAEFQADTSELVQMLRKGHYGVRLDDEAWDRLITWIDLNAPCHGTWGEFTRIAGDQRQRRRELQSLYGGIAQDWEEVVDERDVRAQPIIPDPPARPRAEAPSCAGWPFAAAEAHRRQRTGGAASRTLELGNGVKLELMRIPAGRFVMGREDGAVDEAPAHVVSIDRPYWIGRCEVTNAQFAEFDASHDSRFEHRTSWIFSEDYLGWPLNGPHQPVVRVSWNEAVAFCQWLSQRTNLTVTLPTEAQWEYACRAGSNTPLGYGDLNDDFSSHANMADRTIRDLAYDGWRPQSPDLVPRDDRFNDGSLVTADVAGYRPNPWGLYDMHGNAWEWTRSRYAAYPYRSDDGRNQLDPRGTRVVRGGSWYDRPQRCGSAFRLHYADWQKVYNVGFRVVVEEAAPKVAEP